MKNTPFISIIFAVILLLAGLNLWAQQPATSGESAASAENTEASTKEVSAAKPAGAETAPASVTKSDSNSPGCFPLCRKEFVCHESVCVSRCNPPCDHGYTCTTDAECVPARPAVHIAKPAPPPSKVSAPSPTRYQLNAAEKHKIRMKFRKASRIMFSSDFAAGALKDGRINEFSVHFGIGFRKNLTDMLGFSLRTNLLLGFWEDTTVSDSDRATSAEYTTDIAGFDAELMPYLGPLQRFYFGPIVNYRLLRPSDNEVVVEVNSWYGQDVRVKFPDEQFFSFGFGGGFLLGSKELVNVNWRILSSLTERMPVYVQAGVSFDFPPAMR